MRIIQINNHQRRLGGAEALYLNTIDLLKNKGHEVFTLSRNSGSSNADHNEYFIRYEKAIHKRFFSKKASQKLEELILHAKPDIAHIHNIVGGITFSILPILKKYSIPVVMTVHDFRLLCPAGIFLDGKNRICEKCAGSKYYHCIINRCSQEGMNRSIAISAESYLRDVYFPFQKYVDSFIFVSDFTKNKYLQYYPELENKSHKIYNFTKRFEPNSKKGNYYLFFGRITKEKGLLTLIEAFKRSPNSILKILGSGDFRVFLESEKSANVELLGYKTGDELNEIIKNASFVIVPSECYENNPMTIIEAYSFGKPVIGSNLGGIPEIIDQNSTGYVFESRNYSELTQLVNTTSNLSEEQYTEYSDNAYKYALENFSSQIYHDRLIDVFNKLLLHKRN